MIFFLVAINFNSLGRDDYENKLITDSGLHKKERRLLIKDQNILIWSWVIKNVLSCNY